MAASSLIMLRNSHFSITLSLHRYFGSKLPGNIKSLMKRKSFYE